jgi:hypothetical protein
MKHNKSLRPDFTIIREVEDKTIKAESKKIRLDSVRSIVDKLMMSAEFNSPEEKHAFDFSKNAVKISKGSEDFKRHFVIFLEIYLKGIKDCYDLNDDTIKELRESFEVLLESIDLKLVNKQMHTSHTFAVMLLGYTEGILELFYNHE